MSTPRVGQLWATTDRAQQATRFLRVGEVDERYVHGYSWWDEGASGSGRSTRIAALMFTKTSSKWRLVEDAPGGTP